MAAHEATQEHTHQRHQALGSKEDVGRLRSADACQRKLLLSLIAELDTQPLPHTARE